MALAAVADLAAGEMMNQRSASFSAAGDLHRLRVGEPASRVPALRIDPDQPEQEPKRPLPLLLIQCLEQVVRRRC